MNILAPIGSTTCCWGLYMYVDTRRRCFCKPQHASQSRRYITQSSGQCTGQQHSATATPTQLMCVQYEEKQEYCTPRPAWQQHYHHIRSCMSHHPAIHFSSPSDLRTGTTTPHCTALASQKATTPASMMTQQPIRKDTPRCSTKTDHCWRGGEVSDGEGSTDGA